MLCNEFSHRSSHFISFIQISSNFSWFSFFCVICLNIVQFHFIAFSVLHIKLNKLKISVSLVLWKWNVTKWIFCSIFTVTFRVQFPRIEPYIKINDFVCGKRTSSVDSIFSLFCLIPISIVNNFSTLMFFICILAGKRREIEIVKCIKDTR